MPGPPHPSEPGRRPWGERSQGDSPRAASSSRAPRAGVHVIGGRQTREHPKGALPKGAGLSRRAFPRRRLGAHGVTRAAAGTAWSPFCLRVRAAAGLWRCPPRPMWTLSPGDRLPWPQGPCPAAAPRRAEDSKGQQGTSGPRTPPAGVGAAQWNHRRAASCQSAGAAVSGRCGAARAGCRRRRTQRPRVQRLPPHPEGDACEHTCAPCGLLSQRAGALPLPQDQ